MCLGEHIAKFNILSFPPYIQFAAELRFFTVHSDTVYQGV